MTLRGPVKLSVSPTLDDTLTPAHFKQIGRIAAYWSYAETQVEYIIWGLLNVSPGHGLAITADMRVRSRIKSAKVLAQDILGDDSAKELGAILTRLEDQEQHRNRVIHGAWQSTDDPDNVLNIRYRYTASGPGRKSKITTAIYAPGRPEDLEKIANAIQHIAQDLSSFSFKHRILL